MISCTPINLFSTLTNHSPLYRISDGVIDLISTLANWKDHLPWKGAEADPINRPRTKKNINISRHHDINQHACQDSLFILALQSSDSQQCFHANFSGWHTHTTAPLSILVNAGILVIDYLSYIIIYYTKIFALNFKQPFIGQWNHSHFWEFHQSKISFPKDSWFWSILRTRGLIWIKIFGLIWIWRVTWHLMFFVSESTLTSSSVVFAFCPSYL